MDDPFRHATLGVGVFYRDPIAALGWLERAFGFARSMLVTDADGGIVHAEMRFGDAYVVIDREWSDYVASPASMGGRNTRMVYLRLSEGLDAHFQRAKAAGAAIIQAPEQQFYGERTYRVADPEGHVWTFSQTVAVVDAEEAQRLSGMTIDGWHWPAPARSN